MLTRSLFSSKLSYKDINDMVQYGVRAMAIASVYSVIMSLTRKHTGGALCIVTEAIQLQDRRIMSLLLEIEEYCQKVDNVAYIRMVDSIDRLLLLAHLMTKQNFEFHTNDQNLTITHLQRIKKMKQRLFEAVCVHIHAKQAVSIQRALDTIVEYVEDHVFFIFQKTEH